MPDVGHHYLIDLMALTPDYPGVRGECSKGFCEVWDLKMNELHDVSKDIRSLKKAMDDGKP